MRFLCLSMLFFGAFISNAHTNQTGSKGLYFLGDSVTEGASYFGNNEEIADGWVTFLECDGSKILDGRCSNAEPGALEPNAENVRRKPAANRTIAYSYQARDLLINNGFNVTIENIAVSGARPSTWDPSEEGLRLASERCGQWQTQADCNLDYHEACEWNAHSSCVPAYGNDELDNEICGDNLTFQDCKSETELKCLWYEANTCVPTPGCVGQFLHKGQRWDPTVSPDYERALTKLGYKKSKSQEKLVVKTGILDIPKDSVSILTLGANPMLVRWLNPMIGFLGIDFIVRSNNSALGYNLVQNPIGCMSSDTAAMKCMQEDLVYFKTVEHLKNIYRTLLQKSDVLVMLYYHSCAGFSNQKKPVLKPSKTPPCSDELKERFGKVEDMLNLQIAKAVCEVKRELRNDYYYQINYVCPGFGMTDDKSIVLSCEELEKNNFSSGIECSYFDDHQFDGGSKQQWVSSADSGIHPNPKGHAVLAQSVVNALCQKFGYFCK